MQHKVRVLFDATFLTRQKTGIDFYAERLITTLAHDHSSELELTGYYFDFFGRAGNQPAVIAGISYKRIRWFPIKLLSLTRRLGFQIPLDFIYPAAHKFDVILFPDFVSLPTLSKTRSCVVVYDLCFIDHPEFVSDVNAHFLQRFVPGSVRKADCTIAVSEFTKKRLVDLFELSSESIAVAYPGVTEYEEYSEAKGVSPILYTGTIEPRKNLENLLIAYGRLPKALQAAHPLVLAGGKGWKNENFFKILEELKQQGVPVEYRGYISEKEKAKLYSQASMVALVSQYEGFGMQILEAMSYKKPLLLSNIPVFHEVAGETAYYCDKDSPADIANQLEEILADKRSNIENKVRAYPDILANFTWEKSADTIMKLLRKISEEPK